MRNVSFLSMVVIVFVSLLNPIAHGDEASEQPWFAGYAEADITPAPGQVQMSGFLAASDMLRVRWRHF
jgi:hypothetical protein